MLGEVWFSNTRERYSIKQGMLAYLNDFPGCRLEARGCPEAAMRDSACIRATNTRFNPGHRRRLIVTRGMQLASLGCRDASRDDSLLPVVGGIGKAIFVFLKRDERVEDTVRLLRALNRKIPPTFSPSEAQVRSLLGAFRIYYRVSISLA